MLININIKIVAFFPSFSETRFLSLYPTIQSWALLPFIIVQTNFPTIYIHFHMGIPNDPALLSKGSLAVTENFNFSLVCDLKAYMKMDKIGDII